MKNWIPAIVWLVFFAIFAGHLAVDYPHDRNPPAKVKRVE
jgi:hypothetical protein